MKQVGHKVRMKKKVAKKRVTTPSSQLTWFRPSQIFLKALHMVATMKQRH